MRITLPNAAVSGAPPGASAQACCYALRRLARRVGTTSSRTRSARLTAPAFGNAAAMSGSSTTTFVPSRYRDTYFPRTPLRKSYSGRMVSRSAERLVLFLIAPSFSAVRPPSADYTDSLAALGMGHDEKAPTVGEAKQQKAMFVDRVVGIRDRDGQRIIEHCCGLLEPDAVLPQVRRRLPRIPQKA